MNEQEQKTELELCQEKAQEYLNNWKRAQADLENYKKDENKRLERAIEFCKKTVIEDFFDVMDDLEEALKSYSRRHEQQLNSGYLEGIEMTLNKFSRILAMPIYGVERIKTNGEKFDPVRHEAVQVVQSEGPPGQVVQEVKAGYTMRGEVIRPAKVIISK